MNYLVPTTREVPPISLEHNITPNPFTPGGFKGSGETGAVGPPPTLFNAVADALKPIGAKLDKVPLSPYSVWRAIRDARRDRAGGRTGA